MALAECVGEVVFVEHGVAGAGNSGQQGLGLGEGVDRVEFGPVGAGALDAVNNGVAVLLAHADGHVGAFGYFAAELGVEHKLL